MLRFSHLTSFQCISLGTWIISIEDIYLVSLHVFILGLMWQFSNSNMTKMGKNILIKCQNCLIIFPKSLHPNAKKRRAPNSKYDSHFWQYFLRWLPPLLGKKKEGSNQSWLLKLPSLPYIEDQITLILWAKSCGLILNSMLKFVIPYLLIWYPCYISHFAITSPGMKYILQLKTYRWYCPTI